jgi:hypothetical protein
MLALLEDPPDLAGIPFLNVGQELRGELTVTAGKEGIPFP